MDGPLVKNAMQSDSRIQQGNVLRPTLVTFINALSAIVSSTV